jgi:hypothetical protein
VSETEDSGELEAAARALAGALRHETALARRGALAALEAAGRDKLARFEQFVTAARGRGPEPASAAERAAFAELLAMADENALILEAVRMTLADIAGRLRAALAAGADPGTYGGKRRGPRHTRAARLDATA